MGNQQSERLDGLTYQIPTKLLTNTATLPTYGSEEAAGMDLCVDLEEVGKTAALLPGERRLFKTGISVALPARFYGRIAPRSGLAYKHGIDVMAGVIDSDYRGPVGVILINHGNDMFDITHGDRIAQMIITPYHTAMPELVEELPDTERGAGGFGSTGK